MDLFRDNVLREKKFLQQLRQIAPTEEILCGLIGSTLFINVLSLAFPILLLQIYDRIIPNSAIYTLLLLLIAVCTALVIESILKILRAWMVAWIDACYEHKASCQAFSKILNSQVADYDRMKTGIYLESLNAINTLKDFYSNQIITTLLDLPFIILFMWLIFYIAGKLVLIPILLLCILVCAMKIFSMQLEICLSQKRDSDDNRMNFIISLLNNIHPIKSMSLEMQMLRQYESLQENSSATNYRLGIENAIVLLSSNTIAQLSIVLTLSFGSMMVIHRDLTIGGLAACVLLMSRVLQSVSRATHVWVRLHSVQQAQARLNEIAKLPQETDLDLPSVSQIKGDICLENLYFRYRDNQSWILQDISLQITSGEIIALKSENLSGKTTLLWLMMGMLQPSSGRVMIDRHDMSRYNQQSIRTQISYIPQQGVLFDGTILENITMFRPYLIEKAKQIVHLLGLTSDIQQLPKGYETLVGNRSVEILPHGLMQRICIARALMKDSKIILFDEANIAIDMRSDAILQSVFSQYREKCTWVIVSHKPSIFNIADKVYTLDQGKITEVKY